MSSGPVRDRRIRWTGMLAAAVLLACVTQLPGAERATATTPAPSAPACAGLDRLAIPASAMSLPTTGGRVESASARTSTVSGEAIEYCQADADLFPVDPSAPTSR